MIVNFVLFDFYMKYRDKEISELKQVLDDLGVKCTCLKYSKEFYVCGMCDFSCCDSCIEKELKRMNNSSSYPKYLCNKCLTIYCNYCTDKNIKTCDKCIEHKSALCEYCHERWPEFCI